MAGAGMAGGPMFVLLLLAPSAPPHETEAWTRAHSALAATHRLKSRC